MKEFELKKRISTELEDAVSSIDTWQGFQDEILLELKIGGLIKTLQWILDYFGSDVIFSFQNIHMKSELLVSSYFFKVKKNIDVKKIVLRVGQKFEYGEKVSLPSLSNFYDRILFQEKEFSELYGIVFEGQKETLVESREKLFPSFGEAHFPMRNPASSGGEM